MSAAAVGVIGEDLKRELKEQPWHWSSHSACSAQEDLKRELKVGILEAAALELVLLLFWGGSQKRIEGADCKFPALIYSLALRISKEN